MDYKVYLDYTMELLSKIKIPSYIIDTPFAILAQLYRLNTHL